MIPNNVKAWKAVLQLERPLMEILSSNFLKKDPPRFYICKFWNHNLLTELLQTLWNPIYPYRVLQLITPPTKIFSAFFKKLNWKSVAFFFLWRSLVLLYYHFNIVFRINELTSIYYNFWFKKENNNPIHPPTLPPDLRLMAVQHRFYNQMATNAHSQMVHANSKHISRGLLPLLAHFLPFRRRAWLMLIVAGVVTMGAFVMIYQRRVAYFDYNCLHTLHGARPVVINKGRTDPHKQASQREIPF